MSLHGRSYAINGTSLFVIERGTGAPLLFVHGSVADYSTFLGQMERFARTHRVVVYSRRFHPPNGPPSDDAGYDTAQHAEDLLRLIAGLHCEGAVVIGSSFGASVALVASIRSPGTIRGLVLCEPPLLPLLLRHPQGTSVYENFASGVTLPSRQALREGRGEDALRLFLDGIRGQRGSYDRMLPAVRDELRRFIPELSAEFLSDPARYMPSLSEEELRSVDVPVLLMGGALSTAMFGLILDVLEQHLPRSQRVTIPRAGHMVHLQNADAFETALREYLSGMG